MKKVLIDCIFSLIFILPASAQNLTSSIDTLKKHEYYLASDELKGRETGKEGQKLAADYIARNFEKYGLKPFTANSYFHYYHLQKKRRNTMVVKSGSAVLFSPWHFVYASGYNHLDTLESKLVFAGFGTNAEINPLDIKGNSIAFIAETPGDAYQTILRIKQEYGTKIFFVIFPEKNADLNKVGDDAMLLSLYNLPENFDRVKSQSINEEWVHPVDSVNIYYCFPNTLQNIFKLDDKKLENLAKLNCLQNYSLLSSMTAPKIKCIDNYTDSVETIRVENVGAYIKGDDTTRTVVVSSHYDHIGQTLNKINYGADDNASGTSALLECARLMGLDAKNGIKPKTNVLFMSFSGEELGLLGSEALVSDSSFNLKAVSVDINMDMIGRWDEEHENNRDYVYLLTDGDTEKQLFNIVKSELKLPKGFELSNKPESKVKEIFKNGSDHYSFVKRGIPISVFFTGLHDDYHTPQDTPDKINYENLTHITNIVYQYIYKVSEKGIIKGL